MSRLTELVSKPLDLYPDKECIADSVRRLTYRAFDSLVRGTARNLVRHGVGKGDHIALAIDSNALYPVVYLAVLRFGGVVVPIDVNLRREGADFIIRDCMVKSVILSDSTKWLDSSGKGVHINNILEDCEDGVEFTDVAEDDTACIHYTTGSTGCPKGVVLTHENVYASLKNITDYMGYGPDFRELVALPLTHSFGLNQVLTNLMNGGFAFIARGFARTKHILEVMKEERITCLPGTPTSYRMILTRYIERFKEKAVYLKHILINSSPLPPGEARFILEEFPGITLMVYYGLTEASRLTFHTHSLELDERYLASVGKPPAGIEVAVINKKGDFLGAREVGEVVVKSPTLMKGYWNNTEETEAVMAGRWFRTGDLGCLDEAGYLFLKGRIKDQINIGGLKVSSREIMNAIESLDEVRECYVFGVPDDLAGEVPVACVVLRVELSAEELLKRFSQKLEAFKVPRDLFFLDKIPRSETGKVLGAEMVRLYEGMRNNA